MKAVLAVAILCLFACSVGAAAVVPLSDADLSVIAAGNGGGGGGGDRGSDELDVTIDIDEQGQKDVSALNVINAGGPVQVGTNQLAVGAGLAAISGAVVQQLVVNQLNSECSICDFDEVDLKVDIDEEGQKNVSALNLINTTGSAQVGTNIIGVSGGQAAIVQNSTLSQVVVNSIGAGLPLL